MHFNHPINVHNLQTTYLRAPTTRPLLEKKLNRLGEIPFYSTLSGSYRVLSFAQLCIVDTAKAVSNLAKMIFFYLSKDQNRLNESKQSVKEFSILILHDLSNIFKGIFEILPIVGNCLVKKYNRSVSRFGYAQGDLFPYLRHYALGLHY